MSEQELQRLEQDTITLRQLTVQQMNTAAPKGQFEWYQGAVMLQYTAKVQDALAEVARLRSVLDAARTAALSGDWTACRDVLRDAAGE